MQSRLNRTLLPTLALVLWCSLVCDGAPKCEQVTGLAAAFKRCCASDELPRGCQCFSISKSSKFTNSMFHKPQCPQDLDVKFYLYDRRHPHNTGIPIRAGGHSISKTPYNPKRKTVIVTHGFTDFGPAPWMLTIKDQVLSVDDVNVILVDWKRGAKAPNYFQAVANTRTVGSMIGRFLYDCATLFGANIENVHLVGHSLGAHIMGYAGHEIYELMGKKVGRITGLDPAGPRFEKFHPFVRLNEHDAKFVDVIHTDAEMLLSSGFGCRISIGHVDFYPNGGQHQPGCPEERLGILSMLDFEEEYATGACSHSRAIDIFIYSVRKCHYDALENKKCTMGYHADPTCRGEYRPKTTGWKPYC